MTPKEAVDYFKKKKIVTRKAFDQLAEDARAAAFTVAGIYRDDVLTGFKGEITKALETGASQQTTIKRFREILDGAGHRQLGAFHLETVARTNLQMAYGVGRRRALESVADDLPYWEYHAVMDDRVRPSHAALNGMILPANHPFWTDHYPPWGFNCRCAVTATVEIPSDYKRDNPSGEAEIFYDEKGNPAKAEIGTTVIDLAAEGTFQGVPPQGGLKAVIEAGVARKSQPLATQEVGQFLKLNKDTQFIKPVIEAIESVHAVETLPVLPVIRTRSLKEPGQYLPEKGRLLINQSHPQWALTFVHEVGHFLDHQGIGQGGVFASEKSRLMGDWRRAVQSSNAYKQLRALQEIDVFRRPGKIPTVTNVDQGEVRYLLERGELFARSYAQFIAQRSQNRYLLRLIDAIRHNEGDIYRWEHWEDEDFLAIAGEIERLMVKLRWLK